jgi:hypothetical protein
MLAEPMAPHWVLIRMAAQNVVRRPLRALLLALAVMVGVGIGFAGFVAGWALHAGMATAFARMGADLAAVPRPALVNITASLLTVQPTDETLAAGLAKPLSTIAGVAQVAPQRIVPVLVDGQPANVIAFDPGQDFTVLSWLEDHRPGPIGNGDVIVGGRLPGRPGQMLSLCGKPQWRSRCFFGVLENAGPAWELKRFIALQRQAFLAARAEALKRILDVWACPGLADRAAAGKDER